VADVFRRFEVKYSLHLLGCSLDRVGAEVVGKKKWVRYVGEIWNNLANPSYWRVGNWPGNESVGVGGQVSGELCDKQGRKCKPTNGINSALLCER
jgi:hypothetical protein